MRYFKWILIFLMVSCQKTDEKLPIPKEKLYAVLSDIHVAESAIENDTQVMKDSLSSLYYTQIFEHHGITRKEFDRCMSIMSDNPKLMQSVYKEVLDEIAKRNKTEDTTKKVQ